VEVVDLYRKKDRKNSMEKVDNFAKIFEIIGSKTRLKILGIISDEEKCVNFLSKKLKLSQPTVSYHLRLLSDIGLVKQHKTAQWVRYKLNKDRLKELISDFFSIYGILLHTEGKNKRSSLSKK